MAHNPRRAHAAGIHMNAPCAAADEVSNQVRVGGGASWAEGMGGPVVGVGGASQSRLPFAKDRQTPCSAFAHDHIDAACRAVDVSPLQSEDFASLQARPHA